MNGNERLAVFGILNICEHPKGPMGLLRVNIDWSSIDGKKGASLESSKFF